MEDERICVKLLFFAKARELMEKHEMEALFPSGSYDFQKLLLEILNICKNLQPIAESVILAINEEYVDKSGNISLKTGDEIAVIPPLSGG